MSEPTTRTDNPLETLRYGWRVTLDAYAFAREGLGIYLDVALLLTVLLAAIWLNQTVRSHRAERARRAAAARRKAKSKATAGRKRPQQRRRPRAVAK